MTLTVKLQCRSLGHAGSLWGCPGALLNSTALVFLYLVSVIRYMQGYPVTILWGPDFKALPTSPPAALSGCLGYRTRTTSPIT